MTEVKRVCGEIHDTGRQPLKLGLTEIVVGFCKFYDDGPHILLTITQHDGNEVEIALTHDQADGLVYRLLRGLRERR